MRRGYKYLGIISGIILTIIVLPFLASPKTANPITFIPPGALKKYRRPQAWAGTPVDKKGRFVNAEFPFYMNYLDVLRWLPFHIMSLIKNRKARFPAIYKSFAEVARDNETLVWLGHASFFLRINNTNILIDPHFNNTFIYRRHTDNPIPPAEFCNIQYILLSHDHADHCDKRSLRLLLKNNPQVIVLGGLNMDVLIKSFTRQKVHTLTAEWYQKFPLRNSIKIHFVPARHYCKRIFQKFNGRLWGGFVISYTNAAGGLKTIYYGGDTGYGRHFKHIKQLFKPDIAILPIGSYKPRWFMEPNHMSPEEAVQAFTDCGADQMIPMHYGTFNLSNEDMDEPMRRLIPFMRPEKLIGVNVGEICTFFRGGKSNSRDTI